LASKVASTEAKADETAIEEALSAAIKQKENIY
jgi:hypothetical protein